ncbi:MAG: TonB-dependent receptor [Myxococcaceae bacterium]|nr:TonB-dependent receptor [Myxococcaceae bacterium]
MRARPTLLLLLAARTAAAEGSFHLIAEPRDAGPPAVLAGQVRAMGRRLPLALAQVTVVDGGVAAETDAEGRFVLSLEGGAVEVEVRASGHEGRRFDERLSPGQRLEVLYRLAPSSTASFETVVRARRETEAPRVELGRTELTESAGTQGDPFRAVMLLPGVASIASGLSYPVVRGTQPAATGFFLDGVRVPQLYHLLAGPSVFAPELVERIDFFAGAVPARFGRLTGGVVEARLARPPTRLEATAAVDLLSARAFVAAPIPQAKLDVAVAGRLSYTALIASAVARVAFPSTPENPQPTPVANFQDYQARVEWNPGPGRLRLLAFGAADEGGVRQNGPRTSTALLSNVFHRVDLAWRMPLAGGHAEAGATWGTEQLGLIGTRDGRDVGQFVMRRGVWQGRLRYGRDFGGVVSLEAGADVDRQDLSLEIDRDPVLAIGAASSLREPSTRGTLAGAWVDVAWSPARLVLAAGARADVFALDGVAPLVSAEPRLSARWLARDWLTVRGAAGLAHQAPTVLLNLPVSDLSGLRDGLQRGARFEVGADARLPWLGLEASSSLFFNPLFPAVEYTLEDLLTNRARAGQSSAGVPGRAYGLEVLLRRRAEGRWFGWVSYTLLRSERLRRAIAFDASGAIVEDVTRWVPFEFDQTHVLRLTGGVTLPRGFRVSVGLHVNSGRPESGAISSRAQQPGVDPISLEPTWVPVSAAREVRLPPFARLDVRASKTWTFDDFVLEAFVDVLNASASAEILGYTYDVATTDGRTTLRKTPFAIPLVLPTIGLKGAY